MVHQIGELLIFKLRLSEGYPDSQIKNTEIKVFCQFSTNHFDFFLKYNKQKQPNREWMWNIGESWFLVYLDIVSKIANKKFRQYIKENLVERERQVLKKKENIIKIVTGIVKIFKRSNHY